MKMLKKAAAVLLAAAMSLVMLTACGGGSGSTTQYRLAKTFEGVDKTGKIYMRVSYSGNEGVSASSADGSYVHVYEAGNPLNGLEMVLNKTGFYFIGEDDGKKLAEAIDTGDKYNTLMIAMPTQENLKNVKVDSNYKLGNDTYYAEIIDRNGTSYAYCYDGDNLVYLVFTANGQQVVAKVEETAVTFGSDIDDKIAMKGYTVVNRKT